MALRSTIYKAQLAVADVDRGYYADHALTLARHPSETEERMMVRVLAFALHASEALSFGRGLSSEDEPDLSEYDDTGNLMLWVEVGLPDERWIRKAAARTRRMLRARRIAAGERTSLIRPLADSIATMEIMDEARRQIGEAYAEER